MTKKKNTRNHRLIAIETKEPFTIEHAETLATTFGFKIPKKSEKQESYLELLTRELNHAVKIYYRLENTDKRKPRLSEQKVYISEILKATGYLAKLLENIDSSTSIQLMRSIPNNKKPVFSVELDARRREVELEVQRRGVGLKDRLKTDLRELHLRASIANKKIPPDTGANPTAAVNQLIWGLADIYESETGHQAEIKHKSDYAGTNVSGIFGGDFYNFMNEAINIINNNKTCQLTIRLPGGRTAQNILKRRKKETKTK